jgi:hypothetical protein
MLEVRGLAADLNCFFAVSCAHPGAKPEPEARRRAALERVAERR